MNHPKNTEMGTKVGHEFSWLSRYAPEFCVKGENIEILETPTDFYQRLKSEAKNAQKRVVLAALYLGNGGLEEDLVGSVIDAAKKTDNNVKVDILLDYVRGSRGENNSKTMLKPLIDQYNGSDKLTISLYHTPKLRGLLKKYLPARWNEVIGVAHLKVFIFDDTFIISGANLSNDYFVNRQDRYMVFHDCGQLADYFHQLVNTVGMFSFQLVSVTNQKLIYNGDHHPFEGDENAFKKAAQESVMALIKRHLAQNALTNVKLFQEGIISKTKLGFNNFFQYSTSLLTSISNAALSLLGFGKSIIEKNYDSSQISTHEMTQNFISQTTSDKQNTNCKFDTWVYPTIQMGLFGIRQDEVVTETLMKTFPKGSTVSFTTGYFNVTDKYCYEVVNNAANYNILLSSPEANGFFGSKGFSGYIPAVYIHLCKKFSKKVAAYNRKEDISLWEYIRDGWTFHGKGMFCYLPGEKLPSMSLIGSPNFGLRSVSRDLEAQVVVVTKNPKLQQRLHDEQNYLMKHTRKITSETFQQPRYNVPRWVAFVTFFIKRYF
uniref:CDP-diacylglycerol--glycerol-3-phosphate 3-phosphatidyltransferase, mitochondrial-like n=1 Tax=Styela clava TaxID=7725 RepID=UPI001939436B|nr:CDP-diacylglycerol--glycerol-3-phosphate 3-phosphatidyltransferase, mitochondrial-like [Styela clava]